MDDSLVSGNFSVRGYLPLIQKDSVTQMYGLAVDVKEELLFARNFSLENSADVLDWLYFSPCLTSFSSSLYTVFHAISSQINKFLSINHLLCLSGDFIVHHKDWLTYSGRTDRPG